MSGFERISVAQAKQLISDRKPLIVDVRDVDAYKAAALPEARHVSMSNFPAFRRSADRSAPVLIYCYHGNASQDMAQLFVDFGFAEVYSMDGGFEAWKLAA
jgi:thiosulfate sulfurtransferase